MFACEICGKLSHTSQGRSSHRTQSKLCRETWQRWALSLPSTVQPEQNLVIETPAPPSSDDPNATDNMETILHHSPEYSLSPVNFLPADVNMPLGAEVSRHTETEEASIIRQLLDVTRDSTDIPADTSIDVSISMRFRGAQDDPDFMELDGEGELLQPVDDDPSLPSLSAPAIGEPLENLSEIYETCYPDPTARTIAKACPPSAELLEAQLKIGEGNHFYPFANEVDFELGHWLHEAGLSLAKIDEFLKLQYVSQVYLRTPLM